MVTAGGWRGVRDCEGGPRAGTIGGPLGGPNS
jgi:hypothetical protein